MSAHIFIAANHSYVTGTNVTTNIEFIKICSHTLYKYSITLWYDLYDVIEHGNILMAERHYV